MCGKLTGCPEGSPFPLPSGDFGDWGLLLALLLHGAREHGRDSGDPALQLAGLCGASCLDLFEGDAGAPTTPGAHADLGGIFLVVGGYDPGTLEVSPLVLTAGLLSGLTYGLYTVGLKRLDAGQAAIVAT